MVSSHARGQRWRNRSAAGTRRSWHVPGAGLPFGHIVWTAILGGAIFASASSAGRLRLDGRVLWTFVGVVALHAAWDAAYGVAIRVSLGLGGAGWRVSWPNTESWPGEPSGAELWRFQITYDAFLVLLALVGYVWAIRRWRAYGHDRWTREHPEAVIHH